MIFGVGNDIVEIERVKKALEKKGFKEKIYTDKEIIQIEAKKVGKIASYAGRFSAKEAISKALGTGIRGFDFKDIEILNNNLGKPEVNVKNSLIDILKDKKLEVSISHSEKYATAIAIIFVKE